ncbi:hypothetical protein NEA10_01435 [Phormidium yuhuli AB48]|uniref:HepT-like domain-containing protein n=1 Tax=Phormidium yuhuli AB48 TaxID=2940671 RepID=A0ABY5AQY3_9CYAN|nr:hypothetical protein [Phormidium yuhuli]USR91430.1 hypothetical protein NEA10_01435 [Phormidium yuhuli AB48]
MDDPKKRLLIADLEAQFIIIRDIDKKIKQRADSLNPEDEILLESIAYQIHNIYGASEELLQIVAKYFENNISDASQWHHLLLKRMTVEVPDIRPAFLDSQTYALLNSLRGFRHFFRHGYGTTIDYQQLQPNLEKALNLLPELTTCFEKFSRQLQTRTER